MTSEALSTIENSLAAHAAGTALDVASVFSAVPPVGAFVRGIAGARGLVLAKAVVRTRPGPLQVSGPCEFPGLGAADVTMTFSDRDADVGIGLSIAPHANRLTFPGIDALAIDGLTAELSNDGPGAAVRGRLAGTITIGTLDPIAVSIPVPAAPDCWMLDLSPAGKVGGAGLGQLAGLLGLERLSDAIPEPVLSLGGLALDGLEVLYDPKAKQLVQVALRLAVPGGTAPMIPGVLALESVDLCVQSPAVAAERAATWTVRATMPLGASGHAPLLMEIGPGGAFELHLDSPGIRLPGPGAILDVVAADLGALLPAGVGDAGIDLTALDVTADLGAPALRSARIALAGDWTVISDRVVVENVFLDLTCTLPEDGPSTLTGTVAGVLVLGSLRLDVGAARPAGAKGWTLALSGDAPIALPTLGELLTPLAGADVMRLVPLGLADVGGLVVDGLTLAFAGEPTRLDSIGTTVASSEPWTLPGGLGRVEGASLGIAVADPLGAHHLTGTVGGSLVPGGIVEDGLKSIFGLAGGALAMPKIPLGDGAQLRFPLGEDGQPFAGLEMVTLSNTDLIIGLDPSRPSAAFGTDVAVSLDDHTTLDFSGSIGLSSTDTGLEVDFTATMDDPWHDALGCHGLLLEGVTLKLGLATAGPTIGLAGSLRIPSGATAVTGAAAVQFAADPTQNMLDVKVTEVPLADLVAVFAPDLDASGVLHGATLRDLELYAAQSTVEIGDETYEPGMAFEAALDVLGTRAAVGARMTYASVAPGAPKVPSGIEIAGFMPRLAFGDGLIVMDASATPPKIEPPLDRLVPPDHPDGPSVALAIGAAVPLLNLSASITLMDIRQDSSARVDDKGFAFHLKASGHFGDYADVAYDIAVRSNTSSLSEFAFAIDKGSIAFRLDTDVGAIVIDGVPISQPFRIDVAFSIALTMHLDTSGFGGSLEGAFTWQGETLKVGPLTLEVTPTGVAAVIEQAVDGVEDAFTALFRDGERWADAIAKGWIDFTNDVEQTGEALKNVFDLGTHEAAATLNRMGRDADAAAKTLKHSYTKVGSDVEKALTAGGYSKSATAAAMRANFDWYPHVDTNFVPHGDTKLIPHIDSKATAHVDSKATGHVDSKATWHVDGGLGPFHVDTKLIPHGDTKLVPHGDTKLIPHGDSPKTLHVDSPETLHGDTPGGWKA